MCSLGIKQLSWTGGTIVLYCKYSMSCMNWTAKVAGEKTEESLVLGPLLSHSWTGQVGRFTR